MANRQTEIILPLAGRRNHRRSGLTVLAEGGAFHTPDPKHPEHDFDASTVSGSVWESVPAGPLAAGIVGSRKGSGVGPYSHGQQSLAWEQMLGALN
ncbi:hypothetical protein TSUD_297130 [Trifolium subterraneum]|uniref:Uncharacterized protein n=1 Tax=Trifolium subterraneum TaxID=3900 RepID=A0A2Z6PC31_TRISU|nr:hypothetical protein TSUD_297130 [Trifolium subterraneum]